MSTPTIRLPDELKERVAKAAGDTGQTHADQPVQPAPPGRLAQAHEAPDAAVATAYGWSAYMPAMADDEILTVLLALNLARASMAGAAAMSSG